jgi:succinoglycan biosynthesis protein ExoM
MKIAICICTFRNPEGLSELLDGINRQELKSIAEDDISIVVVDNDADASATDAVDRYLRAGRFKLFARHQPRRGLASARNAALDTTCVRTSDVFVFVDDDEIPSARWIEALLRPFETPQCSIAVGPVEPIYARQPADWIVAGDFFHGQCNGCDESHDGYTSNCMIRTTIIEQSGVRFDESLNHIGGEDVLFFSQLRRRGFNIRCVPDAVVCETIPVNKASFSWLCRRWIRSGGTSAFVQNHLKTRWHAAISNLIGGTGRVVFGGIRTLVIAITRGHKDISEVILSFATVCRGVGMLMAAFGRAYEEYGSSYRPKH